MACEAKLWLKGDLDHLRLAWQTAETLLESLGFDADPEQARYNVLLAVQELLTNVLRHGYGGNSELPVEVCRAGLTRCRSACEVRVAASAVPQAAVMNARCCAAICE